MVTLKFLSLLYQLKFSRQLYSNNNFKKFANWYEETKHTIQVSLDF